MLLGDEEIVKNYLKLGKNLNFWNKNGNFFIYLVVEVGDFDIVEMFLFDGKYV